ncbi:hypothetical protein F4818DRAFT_405927 [Hypoxylon cercidicola]|nr:hypothetical protein F4818DRAFT_405927 [Hypoxylon cercidicola]
MSNIPEKEQLPSYNELRAARNPPSLSPELNRVFWSLDGPFPESIWIMESCGNTDSLEPYLQGDDGKQSWHPAAQAPLTEPKVSSVTVYVSDMEDWENDWLEFHRDHSERCAGNEQYCDGELSVVYGELPDYNEEEDEEEDEDEEGEPGHLLMCCTSPRPRGKTGGMVVKPTTGDFVTVHDYLSTLHPWLLSKRDDVLISKGMYDDKPLPQETKLMVNCGWGDSLNICEQAEWIEFKQQVARKVMRQQSSSGRLW